MNHIRQVYDAAIGIIQATINKIDSAATDGLLGVTDSVAYRAAEIERHNHNWENWLGAAAVPNADIHVADRLAVGVGRFQLNAGNNTWGAWLQILGSGDTPIRVGMAYYDLHRIFITDCQRAASIHFYQIGYGASGAAALAAGTYSELVWKPSNVNNIETPIDVMSRRQAAGTKAWIRCHIPGQNLGTVDLFIGLHEYEG